MSTPTTPPTVLDKGDPRKTRSRLSPGVRSVLAWVLGGLLIGYCAFAGVVLWSMRQPPETFGKVMSKMPGPVPFLLFPFETAWTHARSGNLQIGDQAPDFSLLKLHESERVKLSDLNKTQPVVLVFGSYT
jgi:hypothetical protein